MTAMARSSLEYDEDNRIDLARILRVAFDHKALIITITALFALLGVAYAVVATPVYRASAMIQIEPKKAGITGVPEAIPRPNSVSQAVTEIELIKSRSVLGRTVDALKLYITTRPKYLPLLGSYMARQHDPETDGELAAPLLGMSSYAWGGEKLDIFQLDVPEAYLGEKLILRAGSAGAFSLYDADEKLLLSGKTNEAVQHEGFRVQIADLKARPGTEFAVVRSRPQTTALDYQKRLKVGEAGKDSGIIYLTLEDPDADKANHVLDQISRLYVRQNIERSSAEAAQRLEFLRSQVPLVRKELEKAEAALNDYQTSAQSVDISIETKGVLDQVVALEAQISEHELKRTEYNQLYTPEHPTYQTLMKKIGQLQAQKAALMGKIDTLPMTQQELLRLNRDMQVTTRTYTLLLDKAQEQDILRAGTIGNVRIIDNAYSVVEKPAKPIKPLVVLVAIFVGLLVSAMVILLRQVFYRGVESPETIEHLGIPVYAALPFSAKQEHLYRLRKIRDGRSKLLGTADPADLAIESLRSLRTSLKFAMLEARNQVLVVTSPTPSVGKSFVSSNLASVIAQAGQRVLLIDADMRRGYLAGVFGMAPRNGLSDALVSGLRLAAVINKTDQANLHFVASGCSAPNPSELLMHDNFAKLLKEAEREYDFVIIDTPPVLAVTDAVLVAQQAGTCLLVARYGLSTASQIEASKRRLAQNGVLLKGAILNGVKRKASSTAYETGAYGYYSYSQKA
ncbi:polysaccharide biosynthesis tyrosine autokinase [Pseudomonas sp. MTM4]|uniref:polysaccharide biosynthesis tyrosine autokinase n=1 Tax=unclassified Pseudomonas TaxID=196821 RepID=UPI0018D24602|nr:MULTISPECIES: polysaccharide biosynthesis tyrosine autokinase [unclassified Pseudomonas]MBC8650904.1 polysaccharide biosynthesis tyrosine autokinase [Pseudomonas sp. MT4]QXY91143.1 polysaccharide biosynthesis tyrosine autokinase [Pseudomonas sp. MTM4]